MTSRWAVAPLAVIAGFLIVTSIVLVTYAPSLRTAFRLVDDNTYLHWAGSMPLIQYLAHSLDPRMQGFNYRPLRHLAILLEYYLFHSEPTGYRLVQVLLHLANSLLVLWIVWRLTKRWRLGLLGAVLYAGFPIASEAIFWISDESALATFFSLMAVLFWVNYLQRRKRPDYFLSIAALILAFLTRESSAVIPIMFFLIDRMIVRESSSALDLLRRYLIVAVVWMVYMTVEYTIQLQGVFVNAGGYGLGEHVLSNYAAFLEMLVFPWGLQPPPNDAALLAAGLALIGIAILKRSRVLTFLVLMAFLALGAVVLNPLGAYPRYLYSAAIPWVIFWALVFEWAWIRWQFQWSKVIASITVTCLIFLNSWSTAARAAEFSEMVRQQRVPFRDIMRQHPTFPNNTRLFLIEPPSNTPIPEVAGMFFLRYGTAVSVDGTHEDGSTYTGGRLRSERANLRDFTTAYVYYFDETNRPIEVAVDSEAKTQVAPELPINLAVPIRLEGYEITSSRLRKGQPLVLILYWRALGKIERDYTVFVHLIDSDGRLIVGEDSMPRGGKERTSAWRVDQFTADGHVIPIPSDVPVGGDYQLEVGMYSLPKVERVPLIDQNGQPITDKVIIGPLQITE